MCGEIWCDSKHLIICVVFGIFVLSLTLQIITACYGHQYSQVYHQRLHPGNFWQQLLLLSKTTNNTYADVRMSTQCALQWHLRSGLINRIFSLLNSMKFILFCYFTEIFRKGYFVELLYFGHDNILDHYELIPLKLFLISLVSLCLLCLSFYM